MKFEVSKKVLEKYSTCVVTAKGINNMTAKSRDIILKLEKLKKKKKIPNINPFVNYFNAFIVENNIEGVYANLGSLYGDLKFDFLEEKKPFLPSKKNEVVFCDKGELVFFDEHSVTHRFESSKHGLRVDIGVEAEDVFVCFVVEKASGRLLEQLAPQFANEGKKAFGGSWDVTLGGQIEIDYKTKFLDETLDVVSDLENLAKSGVKGSKGIKKRKGKSLGFANKDTMLFHLNGVVVDFLKKLYPDFDFENRMILSNSPNYNFGHFSTNIAFELSKALGQKTIDVSENIGVKLRDETSLSSIFTKIESTKNGFVNFFLSDEYLLNFLTTSVSNFEKFSSCDVGKGKVILIESPSANPNKAMHLGHILNIFLAQSLKKIYEKIGFEVHNDNIINDKGIPICKALWALQNLGKDSSPEKEGLKSDHFVDKYYVLGAEKFKESKKVEKEVREILRKLENGDSKIIALWKKMISWSLEGQKETMKNLGEKMGYTWFESEIYEIGKKIINENIDGKKIVKTSDGAVVAKLEKEYGVPDTVLLKSDGTSLYHTQDLGLTKLKIEKFNPWLAIWVVGNDQITHFQRLFSLIDLIGLLPIDNLYHLAYGYVFDKDGKRMSSRSGEALSADELLDIIQKKVNNQDIALGALKYAFLSSGAFKDMKFDLEKAILFTGKSGPYVMYAYARACSILKDVNQDNVDLKNVELTDLNREILVKCSDYPNIITSCANSYSPNILADYLYDLAKLFSQMYETEKVLEAKDSEKVLRILIVKLVREILRDGLLLLRINPLERM